MIPLMENAGRLLDFTRVDFGRMDLERGVVSVLGDIWELD